MASFRNIGKIEKVSKQAEKDLVHYFKPVDKGASMPSWYNETQVDEMQEKVKDIERILRENRVSNPDSIRELKKTLEINKARLKEILSAKAEIEADLNKNKDVAVKRYKELEETIKEYQPTRDEMFNKPSRVVDPRQFAIVDKFMTNVVRQYKILGRLLGENSNPELLRR